MTSSASWRIPLGISFFPALVLGLGIIFFPETSRYTYWHGRIDQARAAMSKMYGMPPNHRIVAEGLKEIEVKLEAELSQTKQGLYQIITTHRIGYRFFLGMATGSLNNCAGRITSSSTARLSLLALATLMRMRIVSPRRREFRSYFHWSLCGGAFWPPQFISLRFNLDVCLLHGVCLCAPLRTGSRTP